MNKQELKEAMGKLVNEYKKNPDYTSPSIEKRQLLSWFFVGWWALSIGIHISLKHANLEIHLPFGFITLNLRRRQQVYNQLVISF